MILNKIGEGPKHLMKFVWYIIKHATRFGAYDIGTYICRG